MYRPPLASPRPSSPGGRLGLLLGLLLLGPAVWGSGLTVLTNGWVQGNLRVPPPALGGQARTQSLLERERRKAPELVLLSSGNMLGPSVTSEVDGGAGVVRLMNLAGYDAMAVGPHDLFAGTTSLLERVEEARFPVLWTNLDRRTLDRRWDPVPEYAWVERGGRRVLVFGLVSPALIASWPGWRHVVEVEDPFQALERHRALVEAADVVVALTSMSLAENAKLLGTFPWLDLVVSQQLGNDAGWDFSSFQLEREDGRRILWTNCYGTRIGRVDFDLSGDGARMRASVLPFSADLELDPEALEVVEAVEAETARRTGRTLATLAPEEAESFPETLLDALCAEMNAEVAVLHRGALKPGRPEGEISEATLRHYFPFPDKVARLQVPGKTLRSLWARRNDPIINNKGLALVGLEERRGVLLVNGRPVRDGDRYRLATVEFLALGSLGLLPKTPGGILPREFVDLLATHFSRPPALRERLVRRIRDKPVHRIDTKLDWSYNRLAFGGAADRYQFKAPATLFAASDIPGLVGKEHDLVNFSFQHQRVVDRAGSDTTLRLSANLSKFLGTKTLDRSELLLRRERKDVVGQPSWFAEARMTGTVQDTHVPGLRRPLFGKVVAGRVIRPHEDLKLFLGAADIVRFSQAGDPSDLGVNLGYEFARDLTDDVRFTSRLDSFAGIGHDHVRTFDLSNSLRTQVTPGLSVVARHTRFLWEDDTVGHAGSRNEFYVGLGFTRGARRY